MGMTDITAKPAVRRFAEASGKLVLDARTVGLIQENQIAKGDPFAVAEVAAASAVKRTSELIPFCHNIAIDCIDVSFSAGREHIEARCAVKALGRTGVEMEAMTGVMVALVTLLDMVKYLEKDATGNYGKARITDVIIERKHKGR